MALTPESVPHVMMNSGCQNSELNMQSGDKAENTLGLRKSVSLDTGDRSGFWITSLVLARKASERWDPGSKVGHT